MSIKQECTMSVHTPSNNAVSVQGKINYVYADSDHTFNVTASDKSPETLANKIDTHSLAIVDARRLVPAPSIQEHGFTLHSNAYTIDDYFDQAGLVTQLYPQVTDHLLSITGAVKGIVFDHTIRSVEDNVQQTEKRSPVKTVHNDYTAQSAQQRLHLELEKQGLAEHDFSRYQFINTWIPLVEQVVDSPLAFADVRTFSTKDVHTMKVTYPDRVGEIEAFSFNNHHQWYFYPNMTAQEQLNFKVFDSDQQAIVKGVPHSAFTLPNYDQTAPKRISIEVRSIVLFE